MFAFIIVPVLNFATLCNPNKSSFLGFPTWYKYLDSEVVAGKCTPILDLFHNPGQINLILLAVVEIMLRIAGLVAVGFVIYGGYRYILSQGEPEHTNAARDTIINALIGLVITIFATVIVTFVFRNLAK